MCEIKRYFSKEPWFFWEKFIIIIIFGFLMHFKKYMFSKTMITIFCSICQTISLLINRVSLFVFFKATLQHVKIVVRNLSVVWCFTHFRNSFFVLFLEGWRTLFFCWLRFCLLTEVPDAPSQMEEHPVNVPVKMVSIHVLRGGLDYVPL